MTDRRQFILSAGAAALAAGLPASLFAEEPVRIGFVYVSPIGDAGWTYQHDLARKEMEAKLGAKVQTKFVENVAEGADAERVIREFAASGHKIVFATSFGYMNYVERVARQFPNVTFLHATGYKSAKNFAPLQCALLRRPLPHRRDRRAHDPLQGAGLCCGLPDSRGAAGHQRLHPGRQERKPRHRGTGDLGQ